MKKHLQRILSLLCVLALTLATATVLAEEDPSIQYETRVIIVKWSDGDNYDGLRPKSVNAELAGQPVTLSADSDWTGSVSVPAGTGNDWQYASVDGYTPSLSKGDVSVLTYNHPVSALIPKSGTVNWDDSENEKHIRPESVQLMLLADGELCGEPLIAKAPAWKVTWKDLPQKKPNSDTDISYTVKQVESVKGYTTTASGMTVTNTVQTGTLSLSASVTGAPEGTDLSSLYVTVDGPDPSMPRTLSWGQISGGSVDFGTVLPGAYLVRGSNADDLAEGYIMDTANCKVSDAVYVKPGESKTLVYRYAYKLPEKVDAEDDYDPMANKGNLTFEILGPDDRMPITVNYSQFTNDQYTLDDLEPGIYTVVERNAETLVKYYTLTGTSITGMVVEVGANGQAATARLVNQYKPAMTPEPDAEFVDIPVTKTWNDSNNKDGNRPGSITVRLFADGVEVDSHVLTAAENWAFTFTDKPRFKEDYKTEIVYTVNEDPVTMYNTQINGYNIVNDYRPEVTSVSVTKIWVEPNGDASKRPASIGMTLSDGQKDVTVVVLNKDNNWTATVDNLPTTVNGVPAKYAWKEQGVLGYQLTNVEQNGSNMVFTNTLWTPPTDNPPGKPPKTPGDTWYVFEDYDTPLGVEVVINHVGDCFD